MCPHIILSATLFYLLYIPFRDLRVAFDVFVWRVHSSPNVFVACFSPERGLRGAGQPFFPYSEATW